MKKDSILFKVILFLLIFSAFTLYCGKKAPLKLEPEILPGSITGFKAAQTGEIIKLQWIFPALLSDGKTEFKPENLKRVYIHFSKREIPESKFKRRSDLLKKFNFDYLKKLNDLYFVEIPFDLKKLDKKTYYFGLYYVYKKKKSSMSDIIKLETLIPIKPVSDLKLVNERKANKLSWSRSSLDMLNNRVESISGYNLYRKFKPDNSEISEEFKLINSEKIIKEYYEDRDIGSDGTYSYYVSTIYSAGVFSKDSNIVSIDIKDVFPPDIPENLTVFKGTGFLILTWEIVSDKDLAFYKVFRSIGKSGLFNLIADKIKNNQFKDKNVKKGNKYYYYVVSVDLNGNESDSSKISYEEF